MTSVDNKAFKNPEMSGPGSRLGATPCTHFTDGNAEGPRSIPGALGSNPAPGRLRPVTVSDSQGLGTVSLELGIVRGWGRELLLAHSDNAETGEAAGNEPDEQLPFLTDRDHQTPGLFLSSCLAADGPEPGPGGRSRLSPARQRTPGAAPAWTGQPSGHPGAPRGKQAPRRKLLGPKSPGPGKRHSPAPGAAGVAPSPGSPEPRE